MQMQTNLTFDEMVALVEWHQKRYHDMLQDISCKERLIQKQVQTINELENKLKSNKPQVKNENKQTS